DRPSYTALSYVWGKETGAKRAIVVNGAEFQVGVNLDNAICINQKDVEEKSDQVPRMRSIYSGASNVMIWLG
ncbi:uncharacterized protein BDR25DRAFT_155150, partial [Lindgomyces ingoldianus]